MRKTLLAFTIFSMVAAWPAAGQSIDALGYETASLKIKLCREVYRSGTLRATDRSSAEVGYKKYLECKADATSSAKKAYANLSKKLKAQDAKKALKNYHAALMASLNGSEPKDGEMEVDYRRRISELDERAEMAWQTLLLEM